MYRALVFSFVLPIYRSIQAKQACLIQHQRQVHKLRVYMYTCAYMYTCVYMCCRVCANVWLNGARVHSQMYRNDSTTMCDICTHTYARIPTITHKRIEVKYKRESTHKKSNPTKLSWRRHRRVAFSFVVSSVSKIIYI